MIAFDFDRFDDWHPILSAELADILPQGIGDRVRRKTPEFIEDAGDFALSRRRYTEGDPTPAMAAYGNSCPHACPRYEFERAWRKFGMR